MLQPACCCRGLPARVSTWQHCSSTAAARSRRPGRSGHSTQYDDVSTGGNMTRAFSSGTRSLRRLLRVLGPGRKLPVALGALGAALSAVPCRTTCNVPRCVSLGGSTKQQLVKGTGKVCSACHTVRYCCKACQPAHWGAHKGVCRALQAAAAAAAAASEPADGGQAGADSSVGAPA